ncbi:MAG TPA: D-alanine--D-alanine ligase family protein [Candidatus Limnocylindrales bacterium]
MTGDNRARPVVVLLGGPSAEHDVSVVSGWVIADALGGAGHPVERIFIDLFGGWWSMPSTAASGRPGVGSFDDPRKVGASGPMTPASALESLAARDPRPVVFPALHGPFGEDGTVQALLEAYELPYAGAGVAASAIGMDKAIFKRLVGGMGLPVLEWIEVGAARWAAEPEAVHQDLDAMAERTGEVQLMVKPARLGSSVGMTVAHSPGDRATALDLAFQFDTLAVVERYLDHPRELEVAVLGNEPSAISVFGPGEVFPGREFYDYVAKYADGVSRTVPRAELDPTLAERIREMARVAYGAIGCEGFARVDLLASAAGGVFVSEINTIPGFTPISLFPQMAAAGLGSFGAVCERIVELAEERQTSRVRRRLSPSDLPR